MAGVKRTRSGVDALEHALGGVHTSENSERIISFERSPGLLGTRAVVHVDVMDDSPEEQEVIVMLRPDIPPRSKSRR
jgi:hypothetical protein